MFGRPLPSTRDASLRKRKKNSNSPWPIPSSRSSIKSKSKVENLAELVSKMQAGESNLLVVSRIRPLSTSELIANSTETVRVIGGKVVVLLDPNEDTEDVLRKNRSREKRYAFDQAFGPGASQVEVYEKSCKFLLEGVLRGYNATVFAYGATGAGKTFTMVGTHERPGVMSMAIRDLFALMSEKRDDGVTYRAVVSYIEIYNETIRDLLMDDSPDLELREDHEGNSVVCGVEELEIQSADQLMELLHDGNTRRTQEATRANETSSRSHAILEVRVERFSGLNGKENVVHQGRLFMIDLAGSERAASTMNHGLRMVEGQHINRSLLALGNCINSLGAGHRHKYVNFRDSKLTRLLKDSLGGNCRTVMIACASPASNYFEETYNTMNYANRAKNIKTTVAANTSVVNAHISDFDKIIGDLRSQVATLQSKLAHGDAEDTNHRSHHQHHHHNNSSNNTNTTTSNNNNNNNNNNTTTNTNTNDDTDTHMVDKLQQLCDSQLQTHKRISMLSLKEAETKSQSESLSKKLERARATRAAGEGVSSINREVEFLCEELKNSTEVHNQVQLEKRKFMATNETQIKAIRTYTDELRQSLPPSKLLLCENIVRIYKLETKNLKLAFAANKQRTEAARKVKARTEDLRDQIIATQKVLLEKFMGSPPKALSRLYQQLDVEADLADLHHQSSSSSPSSSSLLSSSSLSLNSLTSATPTPTPHTPHRLMSPVVGNNNSDGGVRSPDNLYEDDFESSDDERRSNSHAHTHAHAHGHQHPQQQHHTSTSPTHQQPHQQELQSTSSSSPTPRAMSRTRSEKMLHLNTNTNTNTTSNPSTRKNSAAGIPVKTGSTSAHSGGRRSATLVFPRPMMTNERSISSDSVDRPPLTESLKRGAMSAMRRTYSVLPENNPSQSLGVDGASRTTSALERLSSIPTSASPTRAPVQGHVEQGHPVAHPSVATTSHSSLEKNKGVNNGTNATHYNNNNSNNNNNNNNANATSSPTPPPRGTITTPSPTMTTKTEVPLATTASHHKNVKSGRQRLDTYHVVNGGVAATVSSTSTSTSVGKGISADNGDKDSVDEDVNVKVNVPRKPRQTYDIVKANANIVEANTNTPSVTIESTPTSLSSTAILDTHTNTHTINTTTITKNGPDIRSYARNASNNTNSANNTNSNTNTITNTNHSNSKNTTTTNNYNHSSEGGINSDTITKTKPKPKTTNPIQRRETYDISTNDTRGSRGMVSTTLSPISASEDDQSDDGLSPISRKNNTNTNTTNTNANNTNTNTKNLNTNKTMSNTTTTTNANATTATTAARNKHSNANTKTTTTNNNKINHNINTTPSSSFKPAAETIAEADLTDSDAIADSPSNSVNTSESKLDMAALRKARGNGGARGGGGGGDRAARGGGGGGGGGGRVVGGDRRSWSKSPTPAPTPRSSNKKVVGAGKQTTRGKESNPKNRNTRGVPRRPGRKVKPRTQDRVHMAGDFSDLTVQSSPYAVAPRKPRGGGGNVR